VNALYAPLKQIAKNAGFEDSGVIVQEVSKKGGAWGFDASADSGEPVYVDMLEAGIIDPVKVTRSGVEHAASAAAVLLTTEAAIADEPEEEKHSHGAPGMGDMGGMM